MESPELAEDDLDLKEARRFLKRHGAFLAGDWQKDPPSRPGFYFVCTGDGCRITIREIVATGVTKEGLRLRDTMADQGHEGVTDWGGLWWSEPLAEPVLPDDDEL